jgi:hypothetical protein
MTDRVREATGEVADAVRAMYASYGDRAGFDRFLHTDITIWESDQPGPLIGLPELDALRDQRTEAAPTTRPTLAVEDLLVDRWGQVAAVARYVLVAHGEGGVEGFRVTDVWHRGSDGWRIVHHHAEAVVAAAPQQENGPPEPLTGPDERDEMTHAG